jgi:hypothetical protein
MNRRITYAYWSLTIALCLFITLSALGDLTSSETVVRDLQQLGYPAHLALFLGAAKLLAVATLLVPGLPRLKEWAYAGLSFDLIGAIYSALAIGVVDSDVAMASVALTLLAGAYISFWLAMRAGLAPGVIRFGRATISSASWTRSGLASTPSSPVSALPPSPSSGATPIRWLCRHVGLCPREERPIQPPQ